MAAKVTNSSVFVTNSLPKSALTTGFQSLSTAKKVATIAAVVGLAVGVGFLVYGLAFPGPTGQCSAFVMCSDEKQYSLGPISCETFNSPAFEFAMGKKEFLKRFCPVGTQYIGFNKGCHCIYRH